MSSIFPRSNRVAMKRLSENKHCFVCGTNNPNSLKLKFDFENNSATAKFLPSSLWEGYEGIVHGGILSTLLDEAMIYGIFFTSGYMTMTVKMDVTFKNPAKVGNELIITGKFLEENGRVITASASISNTNETIICIAKGTYIKPKALSNLNTFASNS